MRSAAAITLTWLQLGLLCLCCHCSTRAGGSPQRVSSISDSRPIQRQPTENVLRADFRPKTIWMSWLQGEDHLLREGPGLNQLAYGAWKDLNPDWQINLITFDNLLEFLPEMAGVYDEAHNLQLYTDLIRLNLLNKYGGVWTDLSVIPMKPLNMMVDELINDQGFFAFKMRAPRGYQHTRKVVQTWFLIANGPRNALVDAWARAVDRRYRQGAEGVDYFQAFFELGDLYNGKNSTVTSIIDHMVHVMDGKATQFKASGQGKLAESTDFPCKGARSQQRLLRELCPKPQHLRHYFYMYKRPKLDWTAYRRYVQFLVDKFVHPQRQ